MRKWRIEDSAELYNINGWGLKYFSINDKGHVIVTPKEDCVPVDLKEINYQQLKNSGVEQIDVCPYCTACGEGKDLFYSYRHSHTGDRHSAVLKV